MNWYVFPNLHITKVLWRICIGIYVHAYIRRERFQFIKWSTFVKLKIYGKTYQFMVRYMFLLCYNNWNLYSYIYFNLKKKIFVNVVIYKLKFIKHC
jgi:hypothetical protein